MSESARLPCLPPEISVRIVAESEETQCCLINLLSRGFYQCQGYQEYATVIYTRGDRDEDGAFTRGSLEVLQMHHRCVYGTTRAHNEPLIPFNPADKLSVELELADDFFIEILRIDRLVCNNRRPFPSKKVVGLIRSREYSLSLTDKKVSDIIPFVDEDGRDGTVPRTNRGAYFDRWQPEDPQLACEKIRHLMIRRDHGLFTESQDYIWDELEEREMTYERRKEICDAVSWNSFCAIDATLYLEWSLLMNLEVLCLDLTGVYN
ncbi:hypothetical protein FGRMN_2487 [Fusarium graminum]|nr:hypothetical protein FGRMN_2487 [Fusarium graminum]